MGALLYGLLASGEKQDWADGDMTGLLEVEKEKNEFYSYNEKDYSYGATGTNGQVMGVSKALCINLYLQYKSDYEAEDNYEEEEEYYEEEQDNQWGRIIDHYEGGIQSM